MSTSDTETSMDTTIVNEVVNEEVNSYLVFNEDIIKVNQDQVPTEVTITEMDEDSNFLYDILHKFDDLCVGARVLIENNYFNFSDEDDIHMVFPNLYISCYSPITNLPLLKSLNIKTIVTALPYSNPPFPEQFNYMHVPLYDDKSENIQKHFVKVNSAIETALLTGGGVLVHCMAGRSRSVTLVMAFLVWAIKGGLYLDRQIENYRDLSLTDSQYADLIVAEAAILNLAKRRVVDKINEHSKVTIPDKQDNYEKTYQQTYDNRDIVSTVAESVEFVESTESATSTENTKPHMQRATAGATVYVSYKKSYMIHELIQIQNNYWDQMRQGDNANKSLIVGNLISLIGQYIRKYRPIACPNDNFVTQLQIFASQ